jgi:hypothetical protein
MKRLLWLQKSTKACPLALRLPFAYEPRHGSGEFFVLQCHACIEIIAKNNCDRFFLL